MSLPILFPLWKTLLVPVQDLSTSCFMFCFTRLIEWQFIIQDNKLNFSKPKSCSSSGTGCFLPEETCSGLIHTTVAL